MQTDEGGDDDDSEDRILDDRGSGPDQRERRELIRLAAVVLPGAANVVRTAR